MTAQTIHFTARLTSMPIRTLPAGAETLVLFLPQLHGDESAKVHSQLYKTITDLHNRGIFRGNRRELALIPTHGLSAYSSVMLVGLGERANLQVWREAAANAARAAMQNKLPSLAVSLLEDNSRGGALNEIIYALTEGLLLGCYRRKTYRTTGDKSECELRSVDYLLDAGLSLADIETNGISQQDADMVATSEEAMLSVTEQAIRTAKIFAEATNYARDLTNFPGNFLLPSTLAEEAQKLSQQYGLECSVLDEKEIAAAGMGGLLAVGQGSVHPPRMIAVKYQGRKEWSDVLGLVGKGITFDTGGISLKKSAGMDEMISDMGGAAVLLGVMRALAQLKPQANVLAVIPAAENMPSGGAYKPGDILTTLSGKTVEVLNTDAEGRIVLADGVAYARQMGASRLIDVATLTGAVLVCLGDAATGAVTNQDEFLHELLEASRKSGENIWQFPTYEDYWDMLKSDVADVKNSTSPNRWAAMITAGLFIGTFVDDVPWIHLDTGGTAFLERERGVDPKGGTGAMVRTLLHLICSK